LRILVAEDNAVNQALMLRLLQKLGHVPLLATNGREALATLQTQRFDLVFMDVQMPELDGLAATAEIRRLVIATVRQSLNDVLAGFQAGANDYITKPFHAQELRARLRVGRRVVELQAALASRVAQLQDALSRVKQLQGLLPICSYCKRIRDDHDYWQQVETYMSEHSQATFTHGICPECYEKFFKTELEELRRSK
jgi:phosphoserine phosphatase RsbU/P